MRRADRLFQIIQVLRRSGRPVTAAALAEELEVSKRTIYRDIADLAGQRVPIAGEAGLGYVLEPGFDMPPLMLTPDEIEAIVLGAQLVGKLPDPLLARAARDVVRKIAAVVPIPLRAFIEEPSVAAKPEDDLPVPAGDMRAIRAAIRDGRKLRLRYQDTNGGVTERTVWPVVLGYGERHAVLIAWCELRREFRHFRTERFLEAEVLGEAYAIRRSQLRQQWERWREARNRDYAASKAATEGRSR